MSVVRLQFRAELGWFKGLVWATPDSKSVFWGLHNQTVIYPLHSSFLQNQSIHRATVQLPVSSDPS